MTIEQYIAEKKSIVSAYLTSYLKQTVLPEISPVGKWGNDAIQRILTLATQGKMLRSALVYLSSDLCTENPNHEALLKTAAALELIQTGLLIHDDIMDRDEKRRGLDSMYIQYQKIFSADGTKNPEKTGESFAICSGDIAYFLAFQILGTIKPAKVSQTLTLHFATQNTFVCIGQMLDVYGGQTQKQLSEKEILAIYEHKTARYTCLLPLVAGALIARASDQTIKQVKKLGMALGILFQITDDKLNLFGDQKVTGKPVGSDIREGKQTLFRYFLLQKSQDVEKQKLQTIFGNPAVTSKDIGCVLDRMAFYHIPDEVGIIEKQQKKIAADIIAHLPAGSGAVKLLNDFIDIVNNRSK